MAEARPWAITQSELTAALRRHTGDPTLTVVDKKEQVITQRRPAMGRIRGLGVFTKGVGGEQYYDLIIKEPQSTTRAGTAGEGLREASFYRVLKEHVPVRIPKLFAAHPEGNWLVLDHLPPGRRPEQWQAADYLLAVDQLVALHDRFWGLDEDLTIYSWLARHLDSDSDIYIQAAKTGAETLNRRSAIPFFKDTEIIELTNLIIDNIQMLIDGLHSTPATLLHGDYWPGNIHIHPDSTLTVYDWEQAGIGPGILDLLGFIQGSRWYFELPLEMEDITSHYRSRLAQAGSHKFKDDEWDMLWDYALLWTFASGWVDILSRAPEPMLETRLAGLEQVLFDPVRQAAARQLK